MQTETQDLRGLKDAQLIDLILESGDNQLFGELYDRYANKVYRKCLSIVKETNTAHDLVQDILVKAFLSLPKFEKRSSFSSWIYAITFNRCMDHLRERQKLRTVEMSPASEPAYEADEDYLHREIASIRVEKLRELMDDMSEDDRLILVMKYQDEMSVADISSTLDLGLSAVKMRLSRARERLRNLYISKFGETLNKAP